MSQNNTLIVGDLVKYHIESKELTDHGFVLGQFYEVKKDGLGLYVRPNNDKYGVALVLLNGDLTESTDYFTKHACPVVLPKGQVNGL